MDKVKAVLAGHEGLGRIHLYECNSIHMIVGPVTISLAPHSFVQVATVVHRAIEELSRAANLTAARLTKDANDPLSAFESHRSRFTH
jgi:hypothetical protein